jgi:hypothetical protein
MGSGLWAQSPQRTAQSAEPTAQGLQVFLITIGQGEQYWEKYGHNMLWFRDDAGIDAAYNWGSFDFDQPGFLRRMLVGDPLYSVETVDGNTVFRYYRESNRSITLQRLNFTPEQARAALERARWNERPENKHYRYDYFLDNCSTRVRDVIDLAVGGALKAATTASRVEWSYRSETVRLLDDMKVTQFGVDVALGRPADAPLSRWEAMFIPMRMRDALRDVRVPGAGGMVSLVADERVVFEGTRSRDRPDGPRLALPYLLVGLLLAAELLAVGWAGQGSGATEKIFRIEVGVWAFLTGVMGLVLLIAWTSTRHTFWYRNENLLLLNPLSLFLAVLAPLSLLRPRWLRPAAICAVVVALLGAVALLLKGVPGSQDNLPLILLFLPAHFAVAFGFWRRASPRGSLPDV